MCTAGRFFTELSEHAIAPQQRNGTAEPLSAHTELVELLVEWVAVSVPLVVVASPGAGWLARNFGLRWRQALTWSYLDLWRVQCGGAAVPGVPHVAQRVQEDTQRLAAGIESICQHVLVC